MIYLNNLDTFEKFLMEKCPSHTNNSPEGFENWLARTDIEQIFDYAMDFRNKAITDYHNHIVEKIEEMKLEIPEYRNKRGHHTNSAHMKIRHNKALQMVLSLLQDTNPKE